MNVVRYTTSEGGEWHKWKEYSVYGNIHSLMFDNGKVWDVYNGWRKFDYCPCCGTRKFETRGEKEMIKWSLFLDDDRYPAVPTPDWLLARNVDDAMWYVKTYGIPVAMSLDHDLGPNRMTGMDFCKRFINYLLDSRATLPDPFDWYIHSQNPVGKDNMVNYMRQGIQAYHDGVI